MQTRRSAATAPDECLRRDELGDCEGERGFGGDSANALVPRISPQPLSTDCGSSLYTHQGSCLPYCPPRYYGRARSATPRDTARACASCHPSCYTCQGASANNCTSCPSGRTFQDITHTCHHPAQGSPNPVGTRRDLVVVTVLACSSLVLAGVLYPTYRMALRTGKGALCCPQARRAE